MHSCMFYFNKTVDLKKKKRCYSHIAWFQFQLTSYVTWSK